MNPNQVTPKLLILDDYEGLLATTPNTGRLRQLADVTVMNRPLEPDDIATVADSNILMAIRERTRLDKAFLDHFPNLELILQTGGHAYHIDQNTATERGIVIALGRRVKTPTLAIPEITFGLMLALIRQIPMLSNAMSQGEWPKSTGGVLANRTLGILGFGRLGQPVAKIAQAFGMRIIAWNRKEIHTTTEQGIETFPLDELLAQSDVISIHLRLAPETKNLINQERLAKMQPHALLINTSRGAIVDEEALINALTYNRIGGAGLDVFATEPLPADSPLRTLPNVVLTPHIGWQVEEVFNEFAGIAADHLSAWLESTLPIDEILNPEAMQQTRQRLGNISNT